MWRASQSFHTTASFLFQCKTCFCVHLLGYLHAKGCTKKDCTIAYCADVQVAIHEMKCKVSLKPTSPQPTPDGGRLSSDLRNISSCFRVYTKLTLETRTDG